MKDNCHAYRAECRGFHIVADAATGCKYTQSPLPSPTQVASPCRSARVTAMASGSRQQALLSSEQVVVLVSREQLETSPSPRIPTRRDIRGYFKALRAPTTRRNIQAKVDLILDLFLRNSHTGMVVMQEMQQVALQSRFRNNLIRTRLWRGARRGIVRRRADFE